MQEFTVNEFISLRLINEGTQIYINGQHFDHCKYLLISILVKEIEDFDGYDTMDEIIKATAETESEREAKELTPETEFWGHCSNLQAWVESRYNYRVLDTKLSIPILIKILKYLIKKKNKEKFRKLFIEIIPTLDDYIINSLDNEATHDKFNFLNNIVCRIKGKYFSDEEITGSIFLKQIYDRNIDEYLKKREVQREYNRKKGLFNRWEAKLWGTGPYNLRHRRFLRGIRDVCDFCDFPFIREKLTTSSELDYLPYLYAKGQFTNVGTISLCYLKDDRLIIRDDEGKYWIDTEKHDRGQDYGQYYY